MADQSLQPDQLDPDDPGAVSMPRPKLDYIGLGQMRTENLTRLHKRLRAAVWWLRRITRWIKQRKWYSGDTFFRHLCDAASHLDQAAVEIERVLRVRAEVEKARRAQPAYEESVERVDEEWMKS